jgi:hypothetical protein
MFTVWPWATALAEGLATTEGLAAAEGLATAGGLVAAAAPAVAVGELPPELLQPTRSNVAAK